MMTESRNIALQLLQFCEDNDMTECFDTNPYYYYRWRPAFCTLSNRPTTRHAVKRHYNIDRYECLRLGGIYTERKKFLSERRRYRRYVNEKDFDSVCPICFEEYGKYRAAWACEQCDHYMCVNCFDRLMREAIQSGNVEFPCPLCRGSCSVPEEVSKNHTPLLAPRRVPA
jgi:hypothetical protein